MKYFITVILIFFSTSIFAQSIFLDIHQKVSRKSFKGEYSYTVGDVTHHNYSNRGAERVSKVVTISIRSSQDARVIVCMFHKSGPCDVEKDFFVQDLHRLKTFKKVYKPAPAYHDRDNTLGDFEDGMNVRGEIMSCFFVYDLKTGELLRSRHTHRKFEDMLKEKYRKEMDSYVAQVRENERSRDSKTDAWGN